MKTNLLHVLLVLVFIVSFRAYSIYSIRSDISDVIGTGDSVEYTEGKYSLCGSDEVILDISASNVWGRWFSSKIKENTTILTLTYNHSVDWVSDLMPYYDEFHQTRANSSSFKKTSEWNKGLASNPSEYIHKNGHKKKEKTFSFSDSNYNNIIEWFYTDNMTLYLSTSDQKKSHISFGKGFVYNYNSSVYRHKGRYNRRVYYGAQFLRATEITPDKEIFTRKGIKKVNMMFPNNRICIEKINKASI